MDRWQTITPDEHGDWLGQRDATFGNYIVLGDKRNKNGHYLFSNYSLGIATGRDAWCYSSNQQKLFQNITALLFVYNENRKLAFKLYPDDIERDQKAEAVMTSDSTKISWNYNLRNSLIKNKPIIENINALTPSLYRPFTQQWLYYDRALNERVYQMPNIFPHGGIENIVICVSGVGSRNGLSVIISNTLVDLNMLEAGAQSFPLYLYEERTPSPQNRVIEGSLFDTPEEQRGKEDGERYVRKDGITDKGLRHFQEAYPTEKISKEDVFYYMYGMLHSPCYREKYGDNLSKELPRIPRVQKTEDFWHFSRAGRELGKLHLHYETVEPYPATITGLPDEGTTVDAAYYRVEKMRYGKGKGKGLDKSIMHYNSTITVSDIPLEAYDYRVNGKPALDWIVERQCVKTDKASGIVNDANDWAIETMHNPKYPLELFLRVITVSLQTLEIVKKLPKLNFDELT